MSARSSGVVAALQTHAPMPSPHERARLCLRVHRQIDVRPERVGEPPVAHRTLRIERDGPLERAHRLVVIERVGQAQPLVEDTAAPPATRGDPMVPVAEPGQEARRRPVRRVMRVGDRIGGPTVRVPVRAVSARFGDCRGRERPAQELAQIGDDADRILPVRRMPDLGIDDEAGAANAAHEAVLLGPRKQRVLVAPEDERAGRDPVERCDRVRPDQGGKHVPPDAGRELLTVAHDGVQEGGRKRPGRRADLEVADERGGNGIGELLDRAVELDYRRRTALVAEAISTSRSTRPG